MMVYLSKKHKAQTKFAWAFYITANLEILRITAGKHQEQYFEYIKKTKKVNMHQVLPGAGLKNTIL